MATMRQKRAIQNLVKTSDLGKAMVEAGYATSVARNPQVLTQSKAFKELAEDYLPDDFLLRALENDIKGKPKRRTRELELAFKVKGRLEEIKTPSTVNLIKIEGFNYISPNVES